MISKLFQTIIPNMGLEKPSLQMAFILSHHIKRSISMEATLPITIDESDTLRGTETLSKI